MGSAAAALVFSFSAQAQIGALPAGTETRPVQLARVVATLDRGESIGRIRLGLVCWGRQNLTWKSGGTTEFNTEELDEVFRKKLQKLGYKVAGDPSDLFADTNDAGAEYLVGGSIEHLNIDVCFPMSNFSNFDRTKGSATVEMKWQIFSRLERRVVATIKTDGSFEEKKSQEGGMYAILLNAFAESVQKLASSEEFRKIFVGAPADLTVARRAPGGLSPIHLKPAFSAPATLGDAVGSTVLIFGGTGHGSGFLVDSDGHLLTNDHVVGGAKYLKVRWSDGLETLGEVVRSDKARDVALVKTDARGRTPLKLRDTPVSVGEDVFAIGAPLDVKLQSSVTKGIVSANRVVDGLSYIQSDVAVNPGNSGGPLLDSERNVIGLTVAGLDKAGVPLGVNLFIPVQDAKDFLGVAFRTTK